MIVLNAGLPSYSVYVHLFSFLSHFISPLQCLSVEDDVFLL